MSLFLIRSKSGSRKSRNVDFWLENGLVSHMPLKVLKLLCILSLLPPCCFSEMVLKGVLFLKGPLKDRLSDGATSVLVRFACRFECPALWEGTLLAIPVSWDAQGRWRQSAGGRCPEPGPGSDYGAPRVWGRFFPPGVGGVRRGWVWGSTCVCGWVCDPRHVRVCVRACAHNPLGWVCVCVCACVCVGARMCGCVYARNEIKKNSNYCYYCYYRDYDL